MFKRGVTLLELLIAVSLIGLISAISIVAINPGQQLASARNVERERELEQIYEAIDLYVTNNNGQLPANIPSDTYQEICRQDALDCTGLIELQTELVPTYLTEIPDDPQVATENGTGYEIRYVTIDDIRYLTVGAINSELGESLAVGDPAYTGGGGSSGGSEGGPGGGAPDPDPDPTPEPDPDPGSGPTSPVAQTGIRYAWGDNFFYQLGNGSNQDNAYITQQGSATWQDTVRYYGSTFHTVMMQQDGSLWAWGVGGYGQLGQGAPAFFLANPTQIGSDTDWDRVAVGTYHNLGIKNGGELWAWGRNDQGQVGDGTGGDETDNNNRATPVRIGTDTDWVYIHASGTSSVGIKSNGTLWVWGQDFRDSNNRIASPTQVGTDTDWHKAITGGFFGIKADGTLHQWNASTLQFDQVGTDTWTDMSEASHFLFLRSDGTLWGFFSNSNDQISGDYGSIVYSISQIGTDSDWARVYAGSTHSIGIKTNGTLWTWGNNNNGQLGNGSAGADVSYPTQVGSDSNWLYAGGGYHFTWAINSSGGASETPPFAYSDGTVASFDPTSAFLSSSVRAMEIDGAGVIAAGWFSGTGENRITRFNADGSQDSTFNSGGSGANNRIWAMDRASDGKIAIGGQFSSFNGTGNRYAALLNSNGTLDTSFSTGTSINNTVRAIAIQDDGKVVIGGEFSSIGGTARGYIARLNSDGSLDTGFSTGGGLNNTVEALHLQSDGKIIIGGTFTTVDGVSRNRIARLNSDGSLDTSFNPSAGGADATVNAVYTQSDGKVLIGGQFNGVNGVSRARIARLNSDGSLDTGFDTSSGASGDVYSIRQQEQDGKIMIGGSFTTYKSTIRNRIARLETNGNLDTSFDPGSGANNIVFDIQIDESTGDMFFGGDFTTYAGQFRYRAAKIE